MIVEIEKAHIDCVEMNANNSYGKFVIEPLERGFGHTLGNALRRVLINSLPGTAVTSVNIEGVQHEFSTIEGVKEDVTEIVLNLKCLAVKLYSDQVKTLEVSAEGPCELTAADIRVDDEVEIVNPDLHIATLGEGAKLHMWLTLDRGRGYVSSDKNKTPQMPIGVIPIDSIYTPIKKVNYVVEDTRVGQITDYDKLTLEVWTNGCVAPDEAIVIENAPLGVRAAKAAGIFTVAVNTGPLPESALLDEGANILFPSMQALADEWRTFVDTLIR